MVCSPSSKPHSSTANDTTRTAKSQNTSTASVTENSYNAFSEYLAEKKHLGGLLILLPTKLSDKDSAGNNVDKGQVKGVLAELEKLLVHEEVPVSANPFIIEAKTTNASIALLIL